MMLSLAPLALAALTCGMLALPLTPAILEIFERKDASPLVTRQDDADIRNFARAFRKYIEPLLPALSRCAAGACNENMFLGDRDPAVLVGDGGIYGEPGQEARTLVLFARQAYLCDRLTFLKDVYAAGNLQGGKENVFRALLGEGEINLNEASIVLRWVHAEGALLALQGSVLYGRTSSEKAVYLAHACRFERVHAPVIVSSAGETGSPAPSWTMIPEERTGRVFGRTRIHGDLHLASEEICWSDIIATGEVRLDDRTRVFGSIKASGDIYLQNQSEVAGSLVSSGAIYIGRDCFIKGPALAQKEIRIGAGTQIGTPQSATTVSAPRIRLAPNCVLHGTLWARIEGWVEA